MKEKPQIPLAGRGGVRAIRFTYADAETVTWKELWFNPAVGIGSYPIYREGRIYCDGVQVLDAATGAVLATASRDGWGVNGIVLADGHFYGCQDAGVNEGSGGASGLGIQKDRVFTAMWSAEDGTARWTRAAATSNCSRAPSLIQPSAHRSSP